MICLVLLNILSIPLSSILSHGEKKYTVFCPNCHKDCVNFAFCSLLSTAHQGAERRLASKVTGRSRYLTNVSYSLASLDV